MVQEKFKILIPKSPNLPIHHQSSSLDCFPIPRARSADLHIPKMMCDEQQQPTDQPPKYSLSRFLQSLLKFSNYDQDRPSFEMATHVTVISDLTIRLSW